ncbi:DUF3155 domain-containing protein, partial [Streptomyces californicus]
MFSDSGRRAARHLAHRFGGLADGGAGRCRTRARRRLARAPAHRRRPLARDRPRPERHRARRARGRRVLAHLPRHGLGAGELRPLTGTTRTSARARAR